MNKEELLKLSPGELTDLGICPTCFNRENGGVLYGDNSDKMLYEDEDIECFFVGNPRAAGHMCISTMEHYHDMSEAPDHINEKIIRFAKRFMQILCEVYGCERVYLCTMCDGLNNHYHIQLIYPPLPGREAGQPKLCKAPQSVCPGSRQIGKSKNTNSRIGARMIFRNILAETLTGRVSPAGFLYFSLFAAVRPTLRRRR